MVSKEQKKIERVINFMKKGLTSLADDLGETVKGINDFIKSLGKAQKDLKEVSIVEEVQTISTSSKKIVAPTSEGAKTVAASTLFSLLSSGGGAAPAATPTAAPIAGIPAAPAPPSAPPGGGPPKKAGPPTAPPGGGPPKKPSLPPAPKLPPAGGGPPKKAGPPGGGPPAAPPAFAKRPGPPGGSPPSPPGAAVPAVASQAGGGLGSLRDEMLDELNRLKKIMRGE